MDEYNRRNYHRGTHFNCTAKVSDDGMSWYKAEILDLSSGGLSLLTEKEYEIGHELSFELLVSGFMSEIDVKVKGKVRRKLHHAGQQKRYGIQFIDLSQDKKIHIDENVHGDRPIFGDPYGD